MPETLNSMDINSLCNYNNFICNTSVYRLKVKIEHELGGQNMTAEQQHVQWSEFVTDLWLYHIPSLHHEVSVSEAALPVQVYGFQKGANYHTSQNEFMTNLEALDVTEHPQHSTVNEDLNSADSDSIEGFRSDDDDDIPSLMSQSRYFQESKDKAKISFLHHDIYECNHNEQLIKIQQHDISLKIPEGAVNNGQILHLEIAVTMHGPFKFRSSDNIQPISPILWLCLLEEDVELNKPFQLVMPHMLTGLTMENARQYNIGFAKASHIPFTDDQNMLSYTFHQCTTDTEFTSTGCRKFGILTAEHCCFYCIKANQTPEFATDAGYCLVRIERPLNPPTKEISFAAIFYLSTCVRVIL